MKLLVLKIDPVVFRIFMNELIEKPIQRNKLGANGMPISHWQSFPLTCSQSVAPKCACDASLVGRSHKQKNLRTWIHCRNHFLEIDEGGDLLNAVFLGLILVLDLDKHNAVGVALVVDFLQLGQHLLAFFVIVVVCQSARTPSIKRKIGLISKLTKENKHGFALFDQSVQHLVCHVLDFVLLQLSDEPLEDFSFIFQVTCF